MSAINNFNAFVEKQVNYFKFLGLFLVFLLLAFDQDLAMIYIFLMVIDKWWYDSDNFISFPISRRNSSIPTWRVYVESIAGLGIFLLISTFLVSTFSPQSLVSGDVLASAQSIFQLLATSTPLLKGSKILTVVGWGIVVPIIETSLFNGRLLEGFATYAESITGKKVSLEKFSTVLMIIVLVIASLFTLLHITAKGLESIPLLITFIFSVISSLLVLRHRELKGAIFFHICTNSMAVLSTLGLF